MIVNGEKVRMWNNVVTVYGPAISYYYMKF